MYFIFIAITVFNFIGDNVKYYFDVGDGRDVIVTDSPSIEVQYPVWRVDPPYKIVIFAVNLLSNVTVETEIAVQRTIQPLTGFNLIHGPENSTEQMQFVLDIATGDWFDCTINWNDSSPTELMTWEQYNSTTPKGLRFHQFEAGEYEVKVNCSSRLYETELTTIAYSYTPVSFFEVDIYRACKFEELKAGAGEFEDMYPVECPVLFYCGKQLGTNVTYEFDYGYADAENVPQLSSQWLQETNETYHTFTFPEGVNNKKFLITIKAVSAVGSLSRQVIVHMLESISNYSLGLKEETIMIGQLANFTATIVGKNGVSDIHFISIAADNSAGHTLIEGKKIRGKVTKILWGRRNFSPLKKFPDISSPDKAFLIPDQNFPLIFSFPQKEGFLS